VLLSTRNMALLDTDVADRYYYLPAASQIGDVELAYDASNQRVLFTQVFPRNSKQQISITSVMVLCLRN